jgi:hypothetical protein
MWRMGWRGMISDLRDLGHGGRHTRLDWTQGERRHNRTADTDLSTR